MITRRLYIPSQKDTPEIDFNLDSGIFSISGISHPENIAVLFEPVLSWIDNVKDEVIKNGVGAIKPIKLNFFFIYINSATYKYLITLILKVCELIDCGVEIEITWCYEPDDVDMYDAGMELYQYVGVKIPFTTKIKERLK